MIKVSGMGGEAHYINPKYVEYAQKSTLDPVVHICMISCYVITVSLKDWNELHCLKLDAGPL